MKILGKMTRNDDGLLWEPMGAREERRGIVQWVSDNGFEIRYGETDRTYCIELMGRCISEEELVAFAESKGWAASEMQA